MPEGLRLLDEGEGLRNSTCARNGRVAHAPPGGFAWQVFDNSVPTWLGGAT